jgi:hypothetical protein
MSEDKPREKEPPEVEELDDEAELLPNREVMSTVNLGEDPAIWDLPVEPRDGV